MKEENKKRFDELIGKLTGRRLEQVNNLLKYLEEKSAYFTAPASPGYHNNWEEGLLEHSMNVAENALKLNKALDAGLDEQELVIAGLFHDLGKAYIGDNNPYYLIKEPTDKQKQYGYVVYPQYEYNNAEQVFMTVPQRAVRIVTQFVDISDACYQAMLIHDGQYVNENKPYACKESPFAIILHDADSWAGFIMEKSQKQAPGGKSYVCYSDNKLGVDGLKVRESRTKESYE